ncbi:calpain-2 catalytic subunit-like isoform X1 [Pygocentrus nattereri]|uniref:Calpain-2 catalytic subunit n=1 Tax=Pygocentrus nattereri TaxID=42514 RepID=A0A3B4EMN3_PYGNA|nr:calpain-2 catalytic subunit-like isoform X1 [Pygocentrus nattereri]
MSGVAGKLQHARERERGLALRYLEQDYAALRDACLREGRLFEDDKFEAAPHALSSKPHGARGVTWLRPKELTTEAKFIVKDATRTDIIQGALGDCWLLAAIASLTLNKKVLHHVVPPEQSFEENYAGIFHFKFWHYGKWVDVVIDDRLPTRNGELLYVHSEQRNEFWSALLEKAYAKLHGCYETLSGGLACDASEDFTGGITEVYKLNKPNLFRHIQRALVLGSLLSCSIDASSSVVGRGQLVREHAYSVTGAEEVPYGPEGFTCKWPWLCARTRPEMIRLIRIRNPWGMVEWKGAWSDGSAEWTKISCEDQARLRHIVEDGEFWMSFTDFVQRFSQLEICNLTPDVLGDDGSKTWALLMFEGSWRRGSTAGGCRDNERTFWMNPQFVIKLNEEDDDPDDDHAGCSFVVSLVQKKLGKELLTIGFTIYKLPAKYSGKGNIHLDHKFFLTHKLTARSETFINRREVCSRFRQPPGEYLIVPSTYDPNQDGDFCLRVFSEKQAMVQELDDQVESNVKEVDISVDEIDGQFISLFGQHVEHGSKLSAFELRRFLDKEVTKCIDIQTEGFSLQSCRNMVNLLDKDGSGKLGLVELKILWDKIQSYGNIYKEKDEDKSGTMSCTEMRKAVEAAGFSLNNSLHQILVARYSQPNLTIHFNEFVDCLVRLECMFKMFQMLDKDGTGKVEFNMTEWLSVTML